MDFFDWTYLATYAGCTAATVAVVQLVKERIPWATQIVSYFVALVILMVASLATGVYEWQGLALVPLNAVVVALTANGAYSAAQRVSSKDTGETDRAVEGGGDNG